MITSLDHVTLACPDIDAGVAAYETLMGRPADWRSTDAADGTATALFHAGNTALELLAPHGAGPVGDRLRAVLDASGPGLTAMAFAAPDIDEAHRILTRRGLAPSNVSDASARASDGTAAIAWRRFRCDDAAMAGLRTFVITERTASLAQRLGRSDSGFGDRWPADGVTRLDHFVIGTPNIQRAAATYGARFGVRLALDRHAPQWNTHFLFFRTGGLTLEIVKRLDRDDPADGDDQFYGMTWETGDIRAAQSRLKAAGLDVSDVRTGRRPGSEVFTLREGTLDVPTLFIANAPR